MNSVTVLKNLIDEYDKLAEETLKGLMENRALLPSEGIKITLLDRIIINLKYFYLKAKIIGVKNIFIKMPT